MGKSVISHARSLFAGRLQPLIGRLKTLLKKINGNGFLAVISVYLFIAGVAIWHISFHFDMRDTHLEQRSYFNISALEEMTSLFGGTIVIRLKE